MRLTLPVPGLPAISVMPAMLMPICRSFTSVLAARLAGALRSTCQDLPPSGVRRFSSVPMPAGIVRSVGVQLGRFNGSAQTKGVGLNWLAGIGLGLRIVGVPVMVGARVSTMKMGRVASLAVPSGL